MFLPGSMASVLPMALEPRGTRRDLIHTRPRTRRTGTTSDNTIYPTPWYSTSVIHSPREVQPTMASRLAPPLGSELCQVRSRRLVCRVAPHAPRLALKESTVSANQPPGRLHGGSRSWCASRTPIRPSSLGRPENPTRRIGRGIDRNGDRRRRRRRFAYLTSQAPAAAQWAQASSPPRFACAHVVIEPLPRGLVLLHRPLRRLLV